MTTIINGHTKVPMIHYYINIKQFIGPVIILFHLYKKSEVYNNISIYIYKIKIFKIMHKTVNIITPGIIFTGPIKAPYVRNQ